MAHIALKLVLTGGPCAGKTTALARLEEDLQELGYHVVIVSESATELIKGGIRPFGEDAINMVDFQKVIIPYQLNKEASYDYAISLLKEDKECVVIYDRGVMDNKAYITDSEFEQIIKPLQLGNLELLDRYDMVLHLVTAACGKEEYYTLENNEARSEGLEEAKQLDLKTREAWVGHEHLIVIDNTTDFEEKMQKVLDSVHKFLGNPISLRRQRNYIVNLLESDLSLLHNAITIEQYYLKSEDGYERRLRKRTQHGQETYYFTTQKKESHGLSEVIRDKKITEKAFMNLLTIYEVESHIKKKRYCFFEGEQYFKLDIFDDFALLQVDNVETNQEIIFPSFLKIVKEVTDDKEYQNITIGKIERKNGKRLYKR